MFWNVIKLRFKILYIRTIRLQWHQAGLTMTSQWFRFLLRRCSSDQGSPSSCKCGGSSLAGTEAFWPCHYSSTPASPQLGRVGQFHESEGEIKITHWQYTLSYHLWQAMISVMGPLHAVVLHQAVVKSGLKLDIIITRPHIISADHQLVTHLQDVTDAVTQNKRVCWFMHSGILQESR